MIQVLKFKNKKHEVFFMILMPASLHVSLIAMKSFPKHNKLIIISNGLTKEENIYLKELRTHTIFTCYSVLRHHIILNILFKYWKNNFGIIDNDCFVRNSKVIDELMQIKDSELLASKYFIESKLTNTNYDIPETFLMFFNIHNINYIRKKYSVSTRIYALEKLPKKVITTFNKHNIKYPEPHKEYFDTLRVIFLLGHIEQLTFSNIKSYANVHGDINEVYHIGAMAKPQNFNSIYGFNGTYFWIKAIESCNDLTLEKIARSKFDYPNSISLVDNSEFKHKIPIEFLSAVNSILS